MADNTSKDIFPIQFNNSGFSSSNLPLDMSIKNGEAWDGSTYYETGSFFNFIPSNSPSYHSYVYGPGTEYPVGFSLSQVVRAYWKYKNWTLTTPAVAGRNTTENIDAAAVTMEWGITSYESTIVTTRDVDSCDIVDDTTDATTQGLKIKGRESQALAWRRVYSFGGFSSPVDGLPQFGNNFIGQIFLDNNSHTEFDGDVSASHGQLDVEAWLFSTDTQQFDGTRGITVYPAALKGTDGLYYPMVVAYGTYFNQTFLVGGGCGTEFDNKSVEIGYRTIKNSGFFDSSSVLTFMGQDIPIYAYLINDLDPESPPPDPVTMPTYPSAMSIGNILLDVNETW